MRLGMICRMDNSGLGTLSWEFARHLRPTKVLLKDNGVFETFPERFKEFYRAKDVTDLLTDIDVLFSIETFYDWNVVGLARSKRVKTVLYTMFEMTQEELPINPSLFLCPSKLDYRVMPEPKEFLPVPVATDRLIWKKRKTAKHFIHTASHGGVAGRKGTALLLEAMKYVKSDIKLTIYSWIPFVSNDPRVEIKLKNFRFYWQAWEEGDVLVYPQDYNGICLPIIEAMSSGFGVITTDIYPFNEYMPKELLFTPSSMYRTRAAPNLIEVDAARIDPVVIAQKIDQWAGKDITKFSMYGRDWAKENSWEKLLPKYVEAIENL